MGLSRESYQGAFYILPADYLQGLRGRVIPVTNYDGMRCYIF